MNKNILSLILIVLAVALTTTFTWPKYGELQAVIAKNDEYAKAVENYFTLIKARDKIQEDYRSVPVTDIDERLEKMIPDSIDNVRLMIDVTAIVAKYGIKASNITTSGTDPKDVQNKEIGQKPGGANAASTVTLSFQMTTTYKTMAAILKEIERSLRILDVSHIGFVASDVKDGTYDFSVELTTYWLKR